MTISINNSTNPNYSAELVNRNVRALADAAASNTNNTDKSNTANSSDASSSSGNSKSYSISTDDYGAADKPKVVKKGQGVDENMFLKILSAELANQDPTSQDSQSSTQYISQLAQFTSLQQMTNLNRTSKMSTANSLTNKYVTFSDKDSNGNNVAGQVIGVARDGDTISLKVITGHETDKDGKTKDEIGTYDIDNLTGVDDLGDIFNSTVNNNMLLNATSLIGKKVNTNQKDSSGNNYSGVVQSVSRETGGVIVKIKLSDGTTKDFDFENVSDVENS